MEIATAYVRVGLVFFFFFKYLKAFLVIFLFLIAIVYP